MLEQWVIDRLNPLKGEKLILLADPQRMIRAGAQAVDGWAKENGFTRSVRVCYMCRRAVELTAHE